MSDIQMPNGVSQTNTSTTTNMDAYLEEIVSSNKHLSSSLSTLKKSVDEVTDSFEDQVDAQEDFFKEEKKARKENKKNQEALLQNTQKALKTNMDSVSKSLTEAIRSPFALVSEPLEKLTGLDLGAVLGGLKEDLLGNKGKGKKNPSQEQVAQIGEQGTGFLYLGNLFEKLLGKTVDKKEGKGKGISNIIKSLSGLGGLGLGGMVAKALPMAAKGLGIGSLVAGIIWAIMDGIKGFFKSEDWGVSKISGVLGGIFAGTGSGLKNAFAGAGKWALIGAGIGTFIGPIGTLVGGLVGAALGGIIGFFGGEKIAKSFDFLGELLMKGFLEVKKDFIKIVNNIRDNKTFQEGLSIVKNIFSTVKDFIVLPFKSFKEALGSGIDSFKSIWRSEEDSIGKKIGKTIGEVVMFFPKLLGNTFKNWFEGLPKIIEKSISTGKQLKSFVSNIGKTVLDFVGNLISTVVTSVSSFFKRIPSMISSAISSIGDFVGTVVLPIVKDVFAGITSQITNGVNFLEEIPIIGDLVKIVKIPFQLAIDNFTLLTETIKEVFKDPKETIQSIFDSVMNKITNMFDGIKSFFGTIGSIDWFAIPGQLISGMSFGEIFESAGETYKASLVEAPQFGYGTRAPSKKINDGIVTKTGDVIETSPEDNILATKKEIIVSPRGGGNSERMDILSRAIELLAQKIALLEPKIMNQTNVVKSFTSMKDLKAF